MIMIMWWRSAVSGNPAVDLSSAIQNPLSFVRNLGKSGCSPLKICICQESVSWWQQLWQSNMQTLHCKGLLKPLCGYVQLHEEITTFNLTHKRWWSTRGRSGRMPQRTKSPLRSPPYLEKHNRTQQMYLLAPWEICAVSWYQCTVQLNSSDNHNANMW